MICNHRTSTIKLHQSDKREMSGTRCLLEALEVNEKDKERYDAVVSARARLGEVMRLYGVTGDEHLKRQDKAEIAAKPKIPDSEQMVKYAKSLISDDEPLVKQRE